MRRERPRLAYAAGLLPITASALFALDCVQAGPVPSPAPVVQQEANPFSFFGGRVVFDLEERVRFESRENNRDFNSEANDNNDDSWLVNRFRLGLALKPVTWLKFYAQTQDSREAYSDRANIPGVSGAEGDNIVDLRQLYLQIGDAKTFPLLLTIGRQGLNYGDNRLVADSRWGNFGRTFDAVRLRYERKDFWVESCYGRPVQIVRHVFDESDAADHFAGVYFSTGWVPRQTTELYVFHRNKEDNQPNLDPTNRTDPQGTWNGPAACFFTIGGRVESNADAWRGWDYVAEAAYEAGDNYQSNKASPRYDLSAFAAHVAGGYTFAQAPWKPRLGVEYNFASGDHNPNDGTSQSFQNLFPSNHEKYGFMDEFSWRNLHDARVQLSAKPVRKLELQIDYHAFWLADTHDYWYRANGYSTLRTTTPNGSDVRTIGARNFAGQEIDFTATYEPVKGVKLQAGYSHFFAGSYLNDTGAHDDADFGYMMAIFSF